MTTHDASAQDRVVAALVQSNDRVNARADELAAERDVAHGRVQLLSTLVAVVGFGFIVSTIALVWSLCP